MFPVKQRTGRAQGASLMNRMWRSVCRRVSRETVLKLRTPTFHVKRLGSAGLYVQPVTCRQPGRREGWDA